ncbi:hypothetical protein INR49_004201, partial [Caranx melampygus]
RRHDEISVAVTERNLNPAVNVERPQVCGEERRLTRDSQRACLKAATVGLKVCLIIADRRQHELQGCKNCGGTDIDGTMPVEMLSAWAAAPCWRTTSSCPRWSLWRREAEARWLSDSSSLHKMEPNTRRSGDSHLTGMGRESRAQTLQR